MTDFSANPNRDTLASDIVDDDLNTPSSTLERQADGMLRAEEERAFDTPRPLRQVVREDARAAGNWGRTRLVRVRSAIEDEPLKSSVIALGLGLVIGLLISR